VLLRDHGQLGRITRIAQRHHEPIFHTSER
jgi:hypothetical protein